MKKLDLLIKLHNHELDQKRLQLKQLEEQAASFKTEIESLYKRLDAERIESVKDVTALPTMNNYSHWNKTQREQLSRLLDKKRAEIEQKMEEIFTAFQELKKYEITDDRIKQREAHELKIKDQNRLDEIAINKDHRNKKNDNLV